MAQTNYYYCFIAGLSDLLLDETEMNFSLADFKNSLKEELMPSDYQFVQMMFLPYDHKNLLNILREKYDEFDELGNYSMEELEEEEDAAILPEYMYRFISEYKADTKSRTAKQWENYLTELFYDYVLQSGNQFLHDWFTFERNATNILTGLTCRKFDKDPEDEVIGDNFVSESIKTSSAKDFGLAAELDYATPVINIAEKDDLLNREKSLDQLKWEHINELTQFHYFSAEIVLAYTLKLQMVYRWMGLDLKTGREMFKQLVDELKESFEFSKEFLINEQRK
ncbi:MAG: DUF2764 family protein [Bacteroidota bacterium]